jgi:hypothetical protein
VDVLIEAGREDVTRVLDALADYGEGFARELTPEDFTDDEGAIRIVEESEFCQIDIFTQMIGLNYADLLPDAGTLELNGHIIRYASKASLIRLKSSSVREKHQLDVMVLQRLEQQVWAK